MSATATRNGNGQAQVLARRNAPVDLPAEVEQLQELPPWMKALRESMEKSISGDVISKVMEAQVEKAKAGDLKAASFVMSQAHKLMASQANRPVTIIQNNYYDTPPERRPDTPLEPGDEGERELAKLRARAQAGQPITGRADDRRTRPVSDAEEKDLRRRQQEEEDEAEREARGPEGD